MPGAGTQINDWFAPPKKPISPTSQFGNPASFTAAADTQAKDYDKIMGMYGDLYNKSINNPLKFSAITPQTSQYSRSSEVGGALSNLSELSQTGGYSDQGIADLRARGVSPIRSIYANAQRDLDRSKSLSGGYSPNYAATTAKLAREMSDKIGGQITDVNAGIAQNVASNRLSAAPAYAGAAERENEARTASERGNADITNQINQFNAQNAMEASRFNRGGAQSAVEGMRGLYGTTPALTKTFGDQVMQAKQSNQNQEEIDNQKNQQMFNLLGRNRLG
jgi:hypothetical protein